MSLPGRTASVRTTSTDSRQPTSRLARPTQTNQTRKIQDTDSPKRPSNSSTTLARDSTVANQASSRIPSPFKRDPPSYSSHSHQANTNRSEPPLRGHSRQRSAVLPQLNARQKFGHSRSISAVSVNTTSTSSSDVCRPPAKSRFNTSQSPSKSTIPQYLPETRTSSVAAPNLRQNASTGNLENLQNEFLQLSVVHREAPQALRAFERSIAASLSNSRAQLMKFCADVYGKKQGFSTASNHFAVDSWLQQLGYQKTCQSVQDLSVAVRDLQNLERIFEGEDGIMAAFDGWRRITADSIREDTQDTSFDLISMHVVFEKELAPQLQQFQQQVASSVATLASLSACPSDSSMSLIIQGQGSVARGLLSECQVILQIGNQLVSEHRRWLDQEIIATIGEIETQRDFTHSDPKPVWDE